MDGMKMDKMEAHAYLYKNIEGGIRLLACRSLDHIAVIPEQVGGRPVLELGDYLFSEFRRETEDGIWSCGDQPEDGELPELKGSKLTEVWLPATVKKVGKYAFYNCERLERLSCHSTTLDWGAGAFTGCKGIRHLDIHVREGQKSCFQEIVSELRQTLHVAYHGTREARLIFPEYYEEAVENTPARILETHMHGCGHQYRYCFHQYEFQFRSYDSLFPYVQVQEKEELVTGLAMGRLRYPYGLTEANEKAYLEYLNDHKVTAGILAARAGNLEELAWLFEKQKYSHEETAKVIEAAGNDGAALSFLMDKQQEAGIARRRRFRL